MARSPKTDVLAQPVGMEATLTERGLRVGIRSRFLAAWDRLGGSRADAKAAQHEGEATIKRARDNAQAELISVAGKILAKEMEADPTLAVAVLTDDFEEASRRYQNRRAVSEMAREEILQLPPPDIDANTGDDKQTELDPDWMNHFYHQSGFATSEDMRRSFARVLSGEIINPGSFAKRSLRSLCELDAETARHFNNFARFRDAKDRQIARQEGDEFPFEIISMLDDAGLIANVPGVGFNIIPTEEKKHLIVNGKRGLFSYHKEKRTKFMPDTRVLVFTLTRFGKDICSILPKELDDLYLDSIVSQLKEDKNIWKMSKVDIEFVAKETGVTRYRNEVVVYEADAPSPSASQESPQPSDPDDRPN